MEKSWLTVQKMGKQQKAKRILRCCTVAMWRIMCVYSGKQGKSWSTSFLHMNIRVRPFMNLNWKNLFLRSFAFLTSKKTPTSTLQPQCFKELNPFKQHCCPTGTHKLLCFTCAPQFQFLHCWLSSPPRGSRGIVVMNTKPTVRTAGKNLPPCLQLTWGNLKLMYLLFK